MAGDDTENIEARLRQSIEAYHDAALLFTAVTAGIPDILKVGPRTVADLAYDLGLSPPHLHRFLRGLVTLRVCEELPDGRFALTNAGQALAHGAESSLREKALVVVGQYWLAWLALMHSLETGEPSFPFAFGVTVADWRRTHAAEGEPFYRYVAKEEMAQADDVLQGFYVLEEGAVFASIGGGYGGLLVPLLWGRPDIKAIVFDSSAIVEAAKPLFRAFGLADRVEFVAGDILADISVAADIYLLKAVLQQHDDTHARTILQNCRKIMRPTAKLVIVERLMPERPVDDPAAVMLDLHMMVVTGGKARTEVEMKELAASAGFSVTEVSKTYNGLSFIEAKPD